MDAPPRQLAPLFQRPTLFLAVYTMLYTPVIETSTSLLQPSAAVHAALSEEQCVVTAPSMTSLHDAPASVYGNEASCSTSAWPCTVHCGQDVWATTTVRVAGGAALLAESLQL